LTAKWYRWRVAEIGDGRIQATLPLPQSVAGDSRYSVFVYVPFPLFRRSRTTYPVTPALDVAALQHIAILVDPAGKEPPIALPTEFGGVVQLMFELGLSARSQPFLAYSL
jgi:hypothetical protein